MTNSVDSQFLVITFIEVLSFSDALVYYVLAMTMTYLTDVWDMSILHAAAVVNIASGAAEILPCVFDRMTYGRNGIKRMALASAFSYSVGLAMLAMSLPSVLARYTGSCSDYKSECIGRAQKCLLFIGLAILSFAGGAYKSSVEPIDTGELLEKLYDEGSEINLESDDMSCSTACSYILAFITELGILVTIVLLGALNPWSPRYGIAAIVSAVGLMAFLCSGSCCSKNPFQPRVRDPRKAARAWFIIMIPLWLTYIALGVVSSVGNSYFAEQADKMKPLKIGHLKIGYTSILWIYWKTSYLVTKLYTHVAQEYKRNNMLASFLAIGLSMVMAVLCCITAAKVEARRLQRVASHGLTDSPDQTVPMTVFWMLPQLLLLGVLDGLCQASAREFLLPERFVFEPIRPYARILNKCVFGIGTIGGSLSVYLVGKASERGGTKPSWFQHTINHSRLDNYYWVLATYSALNLLVFICFAKLYLWLDHFKRHEDDWQRCSSNLDLNAECQAHSIEIGLNSY